LGEIKSNRSISPDSDNAVDIGKLYEINSANTWEYKTIAIEAPTAGTFDTDNTIGIIIYWGFGSTSSDRTAQGTTWGTSNASGTSKSMVTGASTALATTNGATWQITGVQLELGKVATPFEHRSYGEELALCKRYAQVFTGKANKRLALSGNGGNTSYPTIVLPVEMRGDPAITYSALSDFDVEGLNGGKNAPTNLSLNVTSTTAVTLSCTTTGINGSGTNLLFSNSTGWMLLDAEL
jgi:hypothetical protein